jgi:transposase
MGDAARRELSPRFAAIDAETGRPSIPPERWLRALLLPILDSVRSERMWMEQLDDNLLFRWFVGLSMDDAVWDPTVFTKNRDRLLAGEIAQALFEPVLEQARARKLLSHEHSTVDGTLIEADGDAEREAALAMLEGRCPRSTVGCDRGYDTADFVSRCRALGVTPHVAQSTNRRASRIDRRTARHSGYAASQRRRKPIEEVFGWRKTLGGLRKTRHRGVDRVGWTFVFTAAA